jgi:uncharacterized protein (TIGR02996 family)
LTQEDAFLQAILQEPDDDGLRLIFADWLEERAQPADIARAEFIRVQIERARLREDDARQGDLADREQTLLEAHEREWSAPFQAIVRRCGFRRGFVEEVVVDAGHLVAHADTLFRLAPVRHLAVRNVHAFARGRGAAETALRLSPHLSRWHTLDLAFQHIGNPGLHALIAHADLFPGLKALNLTGNSLGREGLAPLLGSSLLLQLDSLDLGNNGVVDPDLERLTRSPGALRLTSLRLPSCGLGNASARLLADPTALPRLTALSLGHNGLDVAGVRALCSGALGPRLKELDFSFNPLRETGPAYLADSENLPNLSRLNLSHASLGDEGVQALTNGPFLGQLTALDLSLNRIGDRGARALARYPGPVRLRRLDLIYNQISPKRMDELRERFGERVCLFRR